MNSELTPMMRQYLDIKKEEPDSILFFRLGDFYEMFFEDAKQASAILHIALTARSAKKTKIPMCGVPHHAADNYIARLVKAGKKVSICEQIEEPSKGKNIVKREIVRVITPGTFIAESLLDESANKYLLSLSRVENKYGLAYTDVSTGEFLITELPDTESLIAELYKISPSETIVPESFTDSALFKEIEQISLGILSPREDWSFDPAYSSRALKSHFEVKSLEGFGCNDKRAGVSAAGALIKYLQETHRGPMKNIDTMSVYGVDRYMGLDKNSHRHLELIKNQQDLTSEGTLFGVLDNTCTSMGRRLLKKWILNPLIDTGDIQERYMAVQDFYDDATLRKNARSVLREIYDIERLTSRIVMGNANARDLRSLAVSLSKVKVLKKILSDALQIEKVFSFADKLDPLTDIEKLITSSIVNSPPLTIKEGGIIMKGFDARIDELREKVSGGKDWVAALQKKEIERTGINSLKIGYNKVFGYYIEVTKAKLELVPKDYIRKQTLVNAERFITEELKKQESEIIGAEEKIKKMEYEVFCDLREKIALEMGRAKKTASVVARLDVLSNLAETAVRNGYVRPVINDNDYMYLEKARHPVLEKVLKDKEFVPNDVMMGPENRIFIITGSNMAGKSTFIRQVALICLMAQIGSFVPAQKAEICVLDKIFTRVGASDRIYQGMSTFMVEMVETANILNNATGRSLIILDEIGRGTSTFDGVSIAWSVVEYLNDKIPGSKTMFATHYHELTELSEIHGSVKNYHLAVQKWKDNIVFLYKVTEGVCDESFGVKVAKMAGLPAEVVKRAERILANLHRDSLRGNIRSRFRDKEYRKEIKQIDFFDQDDKMNSTIEKIKKTTPEKMTPLEALQLINELKNEVEGNEV